MDNRSEVMLRVLMNRYPGAQTFRFGDSEALCAELTALVLAGKKTATCMANVEVEQGTEAMPEVGRRDIALHWDGRPALVIETESVRLVPYNEVDADFALAEGENTTLEGWRDDHRRYFERTVGFDESMLLICERFSVVEILEP
ncbi:MAG: ASCH domain-containing protein [Pseudomonadota bacterium]